MSLPTPKRIVALNGSPHEGFGNTSQLIAMLGENLRREGFEFEEIFLTQHHIEYCTGCAVCLEKGGCWIRDGHKAVARKLLDADAAILASPVYVRSVTGQMKTFLDRSVGYGHRPRGSWKPGLAVSVSAGWGETEVARYLSLTLRMFGSFPVGQLTAIAVGPGEFVGREAVATRAADLARDLALAVKEKRRYPATDQDLDFWNFMGGLIKENKSFMQADYEHWQKMGLLDSFEAYVGQGRSAGTGNREMREAWIRSLMAAKNEPRSEASPAAPAGPQDAGSARELLMMMPAGLNPQAAAGLDATLQFEVSGAEFFTAHLRIAGQRASFHEGPAPKPDVTVKTPADVWLAISRGELDGTTAYMTGKFKAVGDLNLLMKLKSLFAK